jgi:hypothetical protein
MTAEPYLTRLVNTRYLGTHPGVKDSIQGVAIELYEDRIAFVPGGTPKVLPWELVEGVEVLDAEEMQERITLTRLFVLGPFGLLWPKKTVFSYLVVTDSRGSWVFSVPGVTATGLRLGLARFEHLWVSP